MKRAFLWHGIAAMGMVILLGACDGGGSHLGAAEETITITDDDTTDQIIDRPRPYELVISGSRNAVTIERDNHVTQLTISGRNNEVTVSADTTVDSLTFSGNDNVVRAAAGAITNTVDNGSGNRVDTL